MPYFSITEKSHELAAEILRPGHIAVDATVGNGHDTRWLTQIVAPDGSVFGLDIQESALNQCRQRLSAEHLDGIVELVVGGHHHLDRLYPRSFPPPQLILFNLGYLPGGNKTISTQASTTLPALAQSWELLAEKGRLIVVCYPGHSAGKIESEAVENWFKGERPNTIKVQVGPTRAPAPFILYADKGI